MKIKSSKSLAMLMGVLLIGLFFTTDLSALVYFNDSDVVFIENGVESTSFNGYNRQSAWQSALLASSSTKSSEWKVNPSIKSLRTLINEGAINFLKSYSHMLDFLNQVEATEIGQPGVSIDSLGARLDLAIKCAENTQNIFDEIVGRTEKLQKGGVYIKKLMDFKYDEFQENNPHITGKVFEELKGFLVKGNVCDTYKRAQENHRHILKLAKKIKSKINSEKKSVIANYLWQLNQVYSKSMMFGQYTAQIMNEIIHQPEYKKI